MIKKLNNVSTKNNKQNKRTTKNYHTSTLKKKHILNDKLDIFQDQFCINEALAKLENNLLITPL